MWTQEFTAWHVRRDEGLGIRRPRLSSCPCPINLRNVTTIFHLLKVPFPYFKNEIYTCSLSQLSEKFVAVQRAIEDANAWPKWRKVVFIKHLHLTHIVENPCYSPHMAHLQRRFSLVLQLLRPWTLIISTAQGNVMSVAWTSSLTHSLRGCTFLRPAGQFSHMIAVWETRNAPTS